MMLTKKESYARTVDGVAKVLSARYGTEISPNSVQRLTKRQLLKWFRTAAKTQSAPVRKAYRMLVEGAVRQRQPTIFLIENLNADGVVQVAVVSIDFTIDMPKRRIGPHWLVIRQHASPAEEENGENGGNGDDGDDGEEEETCYYEYGPGNVWDATGVVTQGWGDTPENCRCYMECVDCESSLAGVDDCEGSCN